MAGVFPSADGLLGSNQNNQKQQQQNVPTQASSSLTNVSIRFIPSIHIPSLENVKPLIVASSSSFFRSFALQLSIAGAAAMAARSGDITDDAAASIAAHQVALQLWLFCSFVCDALAAASQALVSDAIGRFDIERVRNICKKIFSYSFVLGTFLASILFLGDKGGILLSTFTNDPATQKELDSIILFVILSQPLNAYVFAADGILQGASEFTYEAKSMIISAAIAVGTFLTLEFFQGDPLTHVWFALVTLQIMRGATSTWKMVDANGPIDLLSYKSSIK